VSRRGRAERSALLALLVAAVLSSCGGGNVTLDASPPKAADRGACLQLIRALPRTVADQPARGVVPDDGWGAAWGDPAIVLTCGSTPPEGYDRTSSCTTVDGVDWYLPEDELDGDSKEVTMTTVNRAQYVRVLLPADYWPPATTLVDLAAPVRKTVHRTGRCV
jgi:hypothetical protein